MQLTQSTCVFALTSSSSGGKLYRDARTATFPAVPSKALTNGGVYNAASGTAVGPARVHTAMVIYPSALSTADVNTLRASFRSIYNTNADSGVPFVNMVGDSKVAPGDITRQLSDAYGNSAVKFRNLGVSGTYIGDGGGYYILAQPDPGDTGVLVIGFGTNDIGTINATGDQIWSGAQAYVAGARTKGFSKFIMLTLTPLAGRTGAAATAATRFNSLLRSNAGSLFDAIADYNTIPGQPLGTEPATPNTTYLQDGIHENHAAYVLEMPILKAAIDTALATASKPSCTADPTLNASSATVGTPLTCSTGTWGNAPTSYAYQWAYADTSAAIPGATSSSYTPVTADIGHTLTCTVIATNSVGTSHASRAAAATSAVVAASSGATLLVDTLAQAPTAAISTRKVRAAYSGPAATILNATNNAAATLAYDTAPTTPQITMNSVATVTAAGSSGFTVGQTMTLTAFAGSADVTVTSLPDQMGNGYGFADTSGPRLVIAGTLNTFNSLGAALDFSGNREFSTSGTGIPANPANNTRSLMYVKSRANTNACQDFVPDSNSGWQLQGWAPQLYIMGGTGSPGGSTSQWPLSTPATGVVSISPTAYAYSLNGTSNGSGTGTFAFPGGSGRTSPRPSGSFTNDGYAEWIAFDGSLPVTADVTKVQASQKAQWGTA